MAECTFSDATVVRDYGRPYIIAEVNSSHRGDTEIAKQMIDAAAWAGCDCVKFQSWSAESLYAASYYKQNPIGKRIVQKFSVSPENLHEMALYCQKKGIAFSSTPYSEAEVDFLIEECGAPFVKIASMEINHLQFLRYIAGKHIPVVLSAGMSTGEEVLHAVRTLQEGGAGGIVLLHCVSLYPTPLSAANLRRISVMREQFPECPIGFSDHTEGDTAAVASMALGAALIEKHMTLDRTKVGMDNSMATEPEQLKQLVEKCRSVPEALGSGTDTITPEEMKMREKMRRSIIAVTDLPAGHILCAADLSAKRPGTGLSPDKMPELIGRTLARPVIADTLLSPEDLMERNEKEKTYEQ